jgi:hypothetical protein
MNQELQPDDERRKVGSLAYLTRVTFTREHPLEHLITVFSRESALQEQIQRARALRQASPAISSANNEGPRYLGS